MSIEQKVIEVIAEEFGRPVEEITRETSFVYDLGADSIDAIELILEFEDGYDLDIQDEEVEKFKTVGEVVDYIAGRVGEK